MSRYQPDDLKRACVDLRVPVRAPPHRPYLLRWQKLGAAMSSREETTDVAKVVQALSNGIRSELEVAKTARVPLERVQIALTFLVAMGCAAVVDGRRIRLTDNGNDMLKEANAARRKRQA